MTGQDAANHRDAIPADVPADDAEMWCQRCGRRHGVVWFAASDIWNDVMREGDRGKPDEYGFCCPICFMQLADERGIGTTMWQVASDREIPRLNALLEAHRREFRLSAAEAARDYNQDPDPASSAERCLADFEAEVLAELDEQTEVA